CRHSLSRRRPALGPTLLGSGSLPRLFLPYPPHPSWLGPPPTCRRAGIATESLATSVVFSRERVLKGVNPRLPGNPSRGAADPAIRPVSPLGTSGPRSRCQPPAGCPSRSRELRRRPLGSFKAGPRTHCYQDRLNSEITVSLAIAHSEKFVRPVALRTPQAHSNRMNGP